MCYIWDLAARHFESDFALKRHRHASADVLLLTDKVVEPSRESSYGSAETFAQVKCTVCISVAEGKATSEEKTASKLFIASDVKRHHVTFQDACATLRDAFQDEALQGFPRLAQPYARALGDCFAPLPARIKVTIAMLFSKTNGPLMDEHVEMYSSAPKQLSRAWSLVNALRPRPNTGHMPASPI